MRCPESGFLAHNLEKKKGPEMERKIKYIFVVQYLDQICSDPRQPSPRFQAGLIIFIMHR